MDASHHGYHGRRDHGSLTEKVYLALKEDILSTRLSPGQPIVEAALAQRFRVSKTPVREALRQLVHEGLLDVLPRKGYVVRPVGLVDVMEVLELRRIVEPALAAAAAERRTATDVETLRDLVDHEAHMRPSLDELRTSLDVHARIAAIAGSTRAAALVGSLLDETARIPWLSPWFSPGSSAREHGLIVEAIAAGEAEAAARSMASHLEETQTRTLAALGAR